MFCKAVSAALLFLAIAASFRPSFGAPYYANTHAYGHLQKGWAHHPVFHALGHGPLSHWALSLNGHVKHGLHSLKHAALGFKHELKHGLKHGGLLGLKHGNFAKHGGFVKYADFGNGHIALNAYNGVAHHAPTQYVHHGFQPIAGGAPLVHPGQASHDIIALSGHESAPLGHSALPSHDVIALRGHDSVPLGHPGLASHDVIALNGHEDVPLVFPEHDGSDVRSAVPLSDYKNFPSEG